MSIRIINADCLTALPQLAAEGVRAHSVVCDPPYHLTSIVKRFATAPRNEKTVGKHAYGRHAAGFMGQTWDGGDVAFSLETWAAVMECMRPGAFLVAFASTRGYHRMACAIEDAGFVIHPMLGWLFGSGFPKATRFQQPELDGWRYGLQALKPALEPICLAQKPLDGTGSANWDKHGCGGLNVDACRVALSETDELQNGIQRGERHGRALDTGKNDGAWGFVEVDRPAGLGRWPANVLHDGSDEVLEAFPDAPGQKRTVGPQHGQRDTVTYYGDYGARPLTEPRGDAGSAARFFFCAKADADDRAGSRHPTVKPTALMRWLVQLVTPPGGLVLDPFAGTGSTGLAADQLGMDAILIERDPTYAADAERKIKGDAGLFAAVDSRPVEPITGELFA